MNLPGFTAEASIYTREECRRYVAISVESNGQAVVPQQFDLSPSAPVDWTQDKVKSHPYDLCYRIHVWHRIWCWYCLGRGIVSCT